MSFVETILFIINVLLRFFLHMNTFANTTISLVLKQARIRHIREAHLRKLESAVMHIRIVDMLPIVENTFTVRKYYK